ncbi:flagellin [Endozoicomonas sp. SM1973]|uniref:Flagellin n=1 Tax=Spartinivicinus marinus TaxID=2994442 RepID=A0A853HWV6_9GAMM|nr:flagellin [Spartinivicinus marinus]MCX4029887.1 flagellin [Spartinivicinus marinus]NYZ64869.1 flagellin [Spartinivicinus marinus]
MPQVINTNIASLNAQRHLNSSQSANATALQRLSSGLRINSARDDAAGLSISTRFDTQVRGLNVAIRNANDGISLAQVAEGALSAMKDNFLRIRDLALQAANATNSAEDREALNAEVQQLKKEIQRVSEQTNYNGTQLLDGTFTEVTFQIGANEGENIAFNIEGARVDGLGASEEVGVSARGTTTGIAQGDLLINGVPIPSSKSTSDTASVANKSASAISKVAAINSKSDETGVTAEILTNSVEGTSQVNATKAGNVLLNGVTITLATSANLSTDANREAVVSAINAFSNQTGVVAINTGQDASGIVLEAKDGRNITLIYNNSGGDNVTSAATGLPTIGGTAGVGTTADITSAVAITAASPGASASGGFTLISKDGTPIKIEQGTSGQLNLNVGLAEGTYPGTGAFLSSLAAVDTDATPGKQASPSLGDGDIVINGVPVPAGNALDDTASSQDKLSSAITKAAAINKVSERTGVTATPNPNLVNGSSMTAAATSGVLTINGVQTSTINTTTDSEASRFAVVNAINAISGQTGVIAIDTGSDTGGVQLFAEDGRNITITYPTAGTPLTAASTGLVNTGLAAGTAGTYESSIRLNSAAPITLTTNNANGLTNHGLQAGTFGGAETGQFVQDIDISTVEGALSALESVDHALQSINLQRSNLGAIQNRFESTVSNQALASENLSAANSRIKDADFAAETAELARTQVLQQAGIAMLSQANALPQQVLQLLQG